MNNTLNAVQALASGESIVDSFSYQLTDSQGGNDTAQLNITIQGANDTPETVGTIADQTNDDSDTITSLDLSGFFTDDDTTNSLRFTDGGSLPPGLSIDQDTGVVSGTINADASTSGPYEVTITATDDNGASVTQTFDWTINNPAPNAIDNGDTITENASAGGNVITDNDGAGIDSDPDGDAIQVVAVNGSSANLANTVTGSGGGQFTIGADGTYSFATGSDFDDLAPTETRNTSITYTISDGQGGSSTATLTVQVNGTNDEPTVNGTIADQSSDDSDTIAPLNVSSFFDDLDSE